MKLIVDSNDTPQALALARRVLDMMAQERQPSPQMSLYKMTDEEQQRAAAIEPPPPPGAAHEELMRDRVLPPNLSGGTVVAPPVPPVAPPPPAPLAVDPPAPASTSAPALDSQGLPWDERIHSSSRELIKDGTWKVKRGTPPDLVASVRVELRKLYPAPSTVVAPVSPSAPTPPPVPAVVAPPPPPAPSAPAPVGSVTWIDLMALISDSLNVKKCISTEQLNAIAKQYGAVDPATGNGKFQRLALMEEHWPSVYETVKGYA